MMPLPPWGKERRRTIPIAPGRQRLPVPLDVPEEFRRPESDFGVPIGKNLDQGRPGGFTQGSQLPGRTLAFFEVLRPESLDSFLYGPLRPTPDPVDGIPGERQRGGEQPEADEDPDVRLHAPPGSEWHAPTENNDLRPLCRFR